MPPKKKKVKKRGNAAGLPGFVTPFNMGVLALVLAVWAQFMTYNMGKAPYAGLAVFTLAAFVFWFGARLLKDEKPAGPVGTWVEVSALFVIILAAVFFRAHMIEEFPTGCFRDEGQNGNEAINIMKGIVVDGTALPVYIERWTQNAAMYMYFVAASFKFFDIGVLQIRLVSIVFGILCIPAVYFLARRYFGPRAAIAGALIIAFLRWHVNFSRIGFLGIVTVFFVILAIYFTWRVYQKRRTADFILLGVVAALSLYSYIAARLIPAAIGLFMLYILFREPSYYKKHWKKASAGIIAFLIVFAPLGLYIMKHPGDFMSRASTVSIFNREMLREIGGVYLNKDGNVKHWTQLYRENVGKTLAMFNYRGDGNPRHNNHTVPMLDFVLGIFFVMGIGYALIRWQQPFHFLLLSFFVCLLQAGLFSTEAPQAYRTISVIPVVVMFMLIFIERLWAFFTAEFGKKAEIGIAAALLIALAYSGYYNYNGYFEKQRNNPGTWAEFSTDEYSMGTYLKNLGDDWVGIVQPDWVESYTFKFATYPLQNYVYFDPSAWIPIPSKVHKNHVYILGESYLPLVPVLKSMYPNGRYDDFRHKFYPNRILYFVYEVPHSDILANQAKAGKNGLTGSYYRDNIRKDNREEAVKLSNHWQGNPQFKRLDPFILFNWTLDPIMGPFSVKWEGFIQINNPGLYTFQTRSNDYSDLFINGKQILVNKGGGGGLASAEGSVNLSKGRHKIMVRYYESVHYSKMQFWWKPPEAAMMEVVPSEALFPE